MKGSLTVEASLVFPFCFLILSLVCCLGIFCYNQAVLQISGYESIVAATEEPDSDEKILEKKILENARAFAGKRMLSVEALDVSVKITAGKILLSYRGTQSLLSLPLEATAVYERIFPERTLRLAKTVGGMMP